MAGTKSSNGRTSASSPIFPCLPESKAVAGRAVGAEVAEESCLYLSWFTGPGGISTSEDEKGEELSAVHFLGDSFRFHQNPSTSAWRGS